MTQSLTGAEALHQHINVIGQGLHIRTDLGAFISLLSGLVRDTAQRVCVIRDYRGC